VSKLFDGYGRIVDVRVMTGFGFVEFESPKDAEDALHNFNGKSFMGNNIVVEFAKESRPRRDAYEERGPPRSAPRTRRTAGVRLIVSDISRDTSWQDLKDFGRESGNVSFADIDRDFPGQGILEYLFRDDADRAVRELDGKELRGRTVRVTLDETRAGPDNYRREERRDGRDRYKDDRYRRERSRSPSRRGEHEERRPRSPPPKREYDDRRVAGDDYDRKRDDRKREDKEDRYEDRAARPANGGEGWR